MILVTLQIIFFILFLVAFRGSVTSLVKGSGDKLPNSSSGVRQLDNVYRFMAGIYLGASGICLWMVLTMNEQGTLVYLVGLMVFFAGVGRVISFQVQGIPNLRFFRYAIAELLLSLLIVGSNYFRHA